MPRILIADRDGERAGLVRELLAREGHEVRIAKASEEIAPAARAFVPEAVLLHADFAGDSGALEERIRGVRPGVSIHWLDTYGTGLLRDPVGYSALVTGILDLVGIFAACAGAERREGPWPAGSPRLALYARRVAERMGLPRKSCDEAALAGALLSARRAWTQRLSEFGRDNGEAFERAFMETLKSLRLPFDAARVLAGLAADGGRDGVPAAAQALQAADRFLVEEARGWGGDEVRLGLRQRARDQLDPLAVEALIHVLREEKFVPSPAPRGDVLVGDADPEAARRSVTRLENDGFQAHVFTDGESLLEAARVGNAVLVLCDAALPRRDAFDLLVALPKARPEGAAPVLVTSVRAEEILQGKARALGARAFLAKPVDLEALAAAADEAVGAAEGAASGARMRAAGGPPPKEDAKGDGDVETETITL